MSRGTPLKTAYDFYWLSSYYAGRGDKEEALAALQKSFRLGYRDFHVIHANRAFDCLQDDRRFQQLLLRFCK